MTRQVDEARKLLGVHADSEREAVTNAYRRLARATHPDVSCRPDAAERFASLTAAYRLLSEAARTEEPASRLREPDDGADFPARPGPVYLGNPPFQPSRPWDGPPIVAGPVTVRRGRPGPEREARDG